MWNLSPVFFSFMVTLASQLSFGSLTQSACMRYCSLWVTRTTVRLSSCRNFRIPSCIRWSLRWMSSAENGSSCLTWKPRMHHKPDRNQKSSETKTQQQQRAGMFQRLSWALSLHGVWVIFTLRLAPDSVWIIKNSATPESVCQMVISVGNVFHMMLRAPDVRSDTLCHIQTTSRKTLSTADVTRAKRQDRDGS